MNVQGDFSEGSLLDHALQYARRGWPVFPVHGVRDGRCSCGLTDCKVGKHPRTLHGLKDATTNEKTIHGWWSDLAWANIGIPTGSVSGLIILDVDRQRHGVDSLKDLLGGHRLPKTLITLTGGGGLHIFFAHPGGVVIKNSTSKIRPGIDIRGDGGYVVVPPSRHKSGRCYQWRPWRTKGTDESNQDGYFPSDIPIAPLPPWLLSLLVETKHGSRTEPSANSVIREGQRNDALTSLAGSMQRRGMTTKAIEVALLAENQERCEPPLSEDEVREIAHSVSRYPSEDDLSLEKKKRPSQGTRLIQLASGAELFHTPDGRAFATVQVGQHFETWPLKGNVFRRWLARQCYETSGSIPPSQPLHDAIRVLEGKAIHDGPEHEVHLRLAGHAGKVYVDLANEDWGVIEITPAGWDFVAKAPVKFSRARGMRPLPSPTKGGHIDELRQFVNVQPNSEQEWVLLVSWLVACFRPRGPYPALIIHGEQGSGKSSLFRILRSLIDPNSCPLRAEPRDERDLMIAATNAWLLALDNLSHVDRWLSDAVCRLATGGGMSTRELYSDSEEVLFDAQRPVAINGIEELATRGDLLDRSVVLYLPPIPEVRRSTEARLWREFETLSGRIFGALLTAVAGALKHEAKVILPTPPRMADFAVWATAAESGLRWKPGTFLEAYKANRETANELALESSPLASEIVKFVELKKSWMGTATALLQELTALADLSKTKQKFWPKSAQMLSNKLRGLAPNLRRVGVTVILDQKGRTKKRERLITVQYFIDPHAQSVMPLQHDAIVTPPPEFVHLNGEASQSNPTQLSQALCDEDENRGDVAAIEVREGEQKPPTTVDNETIRSMEVELGIQ